MGEWISVKDRLPEVVGCEVLTCVKNKFGQVRTTICFTGYGDFTWHCNHKEFPMDVWEVTHWMPLPEPPDGKDTVTHARWIAIKSLHFRAYRCSNCLKYIILEENEKLSDYPYCSCGALMDARK